ncbi:unnamed protein product [Symbiodinium natans]|uniref:Uncharacterized protein n=1 Tax=Symbiodinium natans TaxID=878477 RepID=A0A812MB66_9DINO|nr:unnamed protein product [Symbiodinium natans]
MEDLYDGVTDDEAEVMLLQQHINAVRKRNHARSRYMRRGLTGLDCVPERTDVRFSEFYVALVKWLDLQQSRVEARIDTFVDRAKQRCSLSRFSDGTLLLKANAKTDAETPSGFMNLDEFRRLKKEVAESLTGPTNSPRGVGQKILQQRQREKHPHQGRKRFEAKKSEFADSSGSERVSDSDSQDEDSAESEEEEEQFQVAAGRML